MTKEDDDYRPDPFPKESDKDPCDTSFVTALFGPNPELIAELSPYSVLMVAISTDTIRNRTVEVAVVLYKDRVVATIDDVRADNLLSCIKAGRKYRAVVQTIDGGHVLVRIEPLK